jgi:hypothetical protein
VFFEFGAASKIVPGIGSANPVSYDPVGSIIRISVSASNSTVSPNLSIAVISTITRPSYMIG